MNNITIEKNKELVEKYPFLRPYYNDEDYSWKPDDYDYTWTWLDWMPEGWRNAFGEQFCAELKEALTESGEMDSYRIFQIKEKFGELRWYDNGSGKIQDIIDKYTKISAKTCIRCGKPATKLTAGWIMPVCDECGEEFGGKLYDITIS